MAIDKADKVEIFPTTIKVYPNDGLLRSNFSPGPFKDVSYDILSRVAHHDDFKSFKAIGVLDYYFYEENYNISTPKVGLKFIKAGTYIIESNFNIKTKTNRDLDFYS